MSGTAANDAGGARTQLSTITASLSVGLTLAFLLPLFRNLPEAVLGAIVVHAVAHLADVRTLRYYAKLRTGSVWVALVALFGVLQMGILKGLIFAVGLTLIALMHKLSSPQDSILGRLPGSDNFVDVARHSEAEQIPGLLVFRPNGVVFFANANRVHARLRELVDIFERSGFLSEIEGHLFQGVDSAVNSFLRATPAEPLAKRSQASSLVGKHE